MFTRTEDQQILEFINKQLGNDIPTEVANATEQLMSEDEIMNASITDLEEKVQRLSDENKVLVSKLVSYQIQIQNSIEIKIRKYLFKNQLEQNDETFANKFSQLESEIEKLKSQVSLETDCCKK